MPNFRELLQETVRKVPQMPGTWPHKARRGAFRSVLAPEYRANPRSERCSNPFSDSFSRDCLENSLRVLDQLCLLASRERDETFSPCIFALYWLLARLQIEAYPGFPDFPDFPDSLSTHSVE